MFLGKVAFIGAGSIAEALIVGLLESGYLESDQIAITNKEDLERLDSLHNKYGVLATSNRQLAITGASVVFLAMKPKDVGAALEQCKDLINEKQLIISLVAGVSINTIRQLLGKESINIIRAMPTTSSLVRKSATAISYSDELPFEKAQIAKRLFERVGIVAKVEENELHAMTGLFGSGPAYIYYVVEQFERAAMSLGIHRDIAKPFIQQTLIGSISMLQETNKSPLTLRKKVTSPNGTTEAGISVLEDREVASSFLNCFIEATVRSREIQEEYEKMLKI
ncbi:pyrroline-5-carboxylate reductase [Gottfriedia solisilvae]|uniref:Pyrroline-5-carboxylate reductase n=1 Tax=Gottfriedia solisilvae TaxID=1516104 RepID=A0A8J3AJX1_9BACI|nr:pyrroline-5-carboxylate reductase [Gottfriedia solisilvae]GGI11878.1 pyrroline-5-carboxylate reductase [Gottfriedia solisilvae]